VELKKNAIHPLSKGKDFLGIRNKKYLDRKKRRTIQKHQEISYELV